MHEELKINKLNVIQSGFGYYINKIVDFNEVSLQEDGMLFFV